MAHHFDVHGLPVTLQSWVPDEVPETFERIYDYAFAKGREAERAENAKAPSKPSKAKAAVERSGD
jgi:hypothetical protein